VRQDLDRLALSASFKSGRPTTSLIVIKPTTNAVEDAEDTSTGITK
jgi:hypothetical protein